MALTVASVLSAGLHAGADGDGFEAHVHFGYESGHIVSGKWMPAEVKLKNKTSEVFDGRLSLTLINVSDEAEQTVEAPVTLSPNSEKRVTLYIKTLGVDKYTVTLYNKRGRPVYQSPSPKTLMLDGAEAPECVLIGVLTDDYEPLRYLERMESIYDPGSSQGTGTLAPDVFVERVEASRLPTRPEAINAFDAFIIRRFDFSALTDEQKAALSSYVSTGGALLFCGGPASRQTLSGLPGFMSPEVSGAAATEVNKGALSFGNLEVARVFDPALSLVLKDGETPLLWRHDKYNILVISWDPGLDPFARWSENFVYLYRLMDEYGGGTVAASYDEKDYYSYDISGFFEDKLTLMRESGPPMFGVVAVLLLVYMAAAGPVSYAVLSKLDRRELMWVVVPALVLVFSAGVFVYGYAMRGGGYIANTAAIVELNARSAEQRPAVVAASVLVQGKGDYTLDFGDGALYTHGVMKSRGYYAYSATTAPVFSQGASPAAKRTGVPMWSFASATAYMPVKNYGSLEIDADLSRLDKGVVKCSIKNNTGYDLSDVSVFCLRSFATVKSLKYLDTASVEINFGQYAARSSQQSVIEAVQVLYPNTHSSTATGEGLEEKQRSSLMSAAAMAFLPGSADGVLSVFAYAEDGEPLGITINGRRPKRQTHRTVVYQKLDLRRLYAGQSALYPEMFGKSHADFLAQYSNYSAATPIRTQPTVPGGSPWVNFCSVTLTQPGHCAVYELAIPKSARGRGLRIDVNMEEGNPADIYLYDIDSMTTNGLLATSEYSVVIPPGKLDALISKHGKPNSYATGSPAYGYSCLCIALFKPDHGTTVVNGVTYGFSD